MRVVWALGAQEDARDLVAALALRSPDAAGRLAEEFAVAAERLADFPRLGIAVDAVTRYLLIAGGTYRLIYRIDGAMLRILGIGRAPKAWPHDL